MAVAGGARRWLAAACALCACGALGHDATWPGCATARGAATVEVVAPGRTNGNVTGIHFVDCNFTTVNLENLKSYPNLKDIDLKNIKATNVRARTFDYFTNLELLTMSNTSILGKSLPSDLFRNCRRLHYIEFRQTDMSDAPTDLLAGLNLVALSVHNCSLREVPSFYTSQVFPNLHIFQASNNGISKVNDPETFANAANLTTLRLAHNQIDYVHVNVLKPLTKLTTVWLHYNKLGYIPESLFQHKTSLSYIDLSHNLIENIPLNEFLGTNLKYLKLNDNKLTHLPGNFFSNLQISGVHLKKLNFHGNPWECGCLNKLLVSLKHVNIDYDRSQFNGRHGVCMLVPSYIIDRNNCAWHEEPNT